MRQEMTLSAHVHARKRVWNDYVVPKCWSILNLNDLVRVGPVGLEPTTYGLHICCCKVKHNSSLPAVFLSY
jgi:hypothetical protein